MFNPFQKSKKAEPDASKREKPAEAKPAVATAEPKVEPHGERPLDVARGRRVVGALIAPHLTEKATAAGEQGWYTFRVRPEVTKVLAKRAVEDRYRVRVERVRVLARRPKRVRLGRIEGRAPGYKKVMVKVRSGQSIEFT